MSTLIIGEKANAARRIAYALSDGKSKSKREGRVSVHEFERDGVKYYVLGLAGHIVSLDYNNKYNQWSKVDPEELIWVKPEKQVHARAIGSILKRLAKECDAVIIATDFDREGELIGMEAVEIITQVNPGIKVRRARFSALIKSEVEKAFRNTTELDVNLAKAAESRQYIDLAWGAVLTRLISTASGRMGRDFLSVGRVQSPTLAMIVKREMEIEKFVPETYWKIFAHLKQKKKLTAEHEEGMIKEAAEKDRIMKKVDGAETAKVLSYKEIERKGRPPIPFNTTTLLTEATKLGLSASHAMSIAEQLYTEGYISYPRTDNTVYPRGMSVKGTLENLLDSPFKSEIEEILAQPKISPTRGKIETTDHPPVYPVRPATKQKLKGDKWKLYELVVRRFMATVAPYAEIRVQDAELDINGEKFLAHGESLIKEGWYKYYPYIKFKGKSIPALDKGSEINIEEIELKEDQTKPPARYSQASLLKEMERQGLGTKSTRHEIIQKLYDRKYITGKSIRPTKTAVSLVNSLVEHATTITEPEMTATLEKDMGEIAGGKKSFDDVVKESKDMLENVTKQIKSEKASIGGAISKASDEENILGKCPECGGNIRIRRGRNGRFAGCSNYPECKVTYPLPQAGTVEATGRQCEVCGAPVIRITRSGGKEEMCINPTCSTNEGRGVVGKCPMCGGDLILRYSRRGKRFIGCSNYPACGNTYPLPQRGKLDFTGETCPHCGAPIVVVITKGRPPWRLCVNPNCPGKEKKEKKGKVKKSSEKTVKSSSKKANAKKKAGKPAGKSGSKKAGKKST